MHNPYLRIINHKFDQKFSFIWDMHTEISWILRTGGKPNKSTRFFACTLKKIGSLGVHNAMHNNRLKPVRIPFNRSLHAWYCVYQWKVGHPCVWRAFYVRFKTVFIRILFFNFSDKISQPKVNVERLLLNWRAHHSPGKDFLDFRFSI